MCGIVGYVGHRNAIDFLIDGLRRLEYRGYDSVGVVTLNGESGQAGPYVKKEVGRVDSLVGKINGHPMPGSTGIGHTRWATHGRATVDNAHPHFGGEQLVAIAHNGVIENHQELRDRVSAAGYECESSTDSEVIAQLIAMELENTVDETQRSKSWETPVAAVKSALSQLRGTYGLVVVFRDWPDMIIAARLGSPLVVGTGAGEHFVASDPSPLPGYTDQIVYLADHQIAVVEANSLKVMHRDGGPVEHTVDQLALDYQDVSLDGYPHYMLKEIFEQPESLRNTMRGRIDEENATAVFGGLNLTACQLRSVNRILLTACGTSWHAALVGEHMVESMARLPVEVDYASELRYRNAPLDQDSLLFAISQSGETADTLAAMRELKRTGHHTLSICNVVGSTIAMEADGGIFLRAGSEIGVASSKAYTSQLMALALLALYFGRLRHLSFEDGIKIIETLRSLPDKVADALKTDSDVRRIAGKYCDANNFLFMGRQYNFPTALEGALKLKEISYVHAEGYPAAEMKHGPIALVDKSTPSVFVVPQCYVYDKVMANIEEVKARGGPVIAIVGEGDTSVERLADDVIYVPRVEEFAQPFVTVVPLQLLAYHIAVLRGCDVDKPRNLAKSVTVE